LVTVGTALDPFDRLITFADTMLASLGRDVTGLCQFGRCSVRSCTLENVAFLERAQFLDAIENADVVFTGAGVGTLSMCIRAGHRPVVLPRRHDLGECVNDHQFELVHALAHRNHIIDATRDDIGAILQGAVKDGLRKPHRQDTLSLPPINFSHTARYHSLPAQAVRALSKWMSLGSMRVL
jgi:UDP-N-acetylglucosamine transferase subunit ALG13